MTNLRKEYKATMKLSVVINFSLTSVASNTAFMSSRLTSSYSMNLTGSYPFLNHSSFLMSSVRMRYKGQKEEKAQQQSGRITPHDRLYENVRQKSCFLSNKKHNKFRGDELYRLNPTTKTSEIKHSRTAKQKTSSYK